MAPWGLVLATAATVIAAVQSQNIQIPPPPRGYSPTAADIVVDGARVLSQGTIDRINRISFDVKSKSGGEIAVVTLSDLGGRDVADVARTIGREWQVGANAQPGDRARNAGVIILVVPKETASDGRGRIRIETGRGVEGFITDATAGDIQRAAIPYFQRQDYNGALELITQRVAAEFAQEFGFALDTALVPPAPAFTPEPSGRAERGIPPGLILLGFILLFSVLSRSASRRRGCGGGGCIPLPIIIPSGGYHRHRGGWGGGGFGGFGGGGGFGGFGGGGGFSGGGSSGSW